MKASLTGMALFLFLTGGTFLLPAQTNGSANPAQPSGGQANAMISFLTPAQQEQYAVARAKALADNPDLKTEGENLMKQASSVMANGTPEDKQAFLEGMSSHRQKLRAAMLKEDPTLEPIFAVIDKHIAEAKAKSLSEAQTSAGATNAPPVSSSSNH